MFKSREGGSSDSGDGRRNNRPPDKYKIKPGEVRNPFGRAGKPAQTPLTSIDELYLQQGKRTVSRDENGETSAAERLVQEEFHSALVKGDAAARVRTIAQIAQASAKAEKERDEAIGWFLSRKAELTDEFYEAKRSGREPPDILPHPDHVHVIGDQIVINGPTDRRGREVWEHCKAIIQFAAYFHQRARERYRLESTEENAADLAAMAAHRRWVMRCVPKGWNWREQIYCRDSWSKFVADELQKLRSLPDAQY
jgi:hypothetical protein